VTFGSGKPRWTGAEPGLRRKARSDAW